VSKARKRARAAAAQPPSDITDRQTLLAALRANRVPDGWCAIPGLVHAFDARGYLFMDHDDGQWIVGWMERGRAFDVERYPTERDAARSLFEQTMRSWDRARNPNRRRPYVVPWPQDSPGTDIQTDRR
jgi:hypothetical protein